RQLSGHPDPRVSGIPLGNGEREVIALALQFDVDRVVLDDEAARRLAIALGLPVIGTLGILVLAKQEGIVAAVRPLVEALAEVGEVAVGS
ncbi:MAG: hypothetical protein QOF73_3318, partial [Thermomicrobiales bacterium]|nr:hypothetical protein [Thermomicrobiales bacterium]